MKFISGGDFVFPFSFKTYFNEQIYLWSYNAGVPNLDEIIRFFIRLPNVLIYGLTGSNVAVSYFYICGIALVCFLSFRYFCKHFIDIKDKKTLFALSLLYTLNPIFLGNYAKIGLILAATMLPLLITFVRKYFDTEKLRYLLLIVLALNVSFIHPFTLAVNIGLTAAYFLALSLKDRGTFVRSLPKLAIAGITGLLINAYIILSVLSLGSVEKRLLSQNLSDTSLSSANLTNIANTGDILTAFSMSKNVFLDFQFYNGAYKYLYFVGVYVLLALLIWLFMSGYYKMVKKYKKFLLISMLGFLGLMLLTTGTFMGVDTFLGLLAKLPGGWAFRSPLKWQLYMPLFFCAIIALLLEVQRIDYRKYSYMALGVIIILINGYIGYDMTKKLLLPDTSHVVLQTQNIPASSSRALLIKDAQCYLYFTHDFSMLNNIREVYAAHAVQLKEIDAPDVEGVNLNNYAQVISCSKPKELDLYSFKEVGNISTSANQLFAFDNQNTKPKVYLTELVGIPHASLNLGTKQSLLDPSEKARSDFVDQEDKIASSKSIAELFETVSSKDIEEGALQSVLNLEYFKNNPEIVTKENTHYKIEDQKISLFAGNPKGTQNLDGTLDIPQELTQNESIKISYSNENYRLNNLVKNPSLEEGLWQSKIGDCFNYDSSPKISMQLNADDKTDGKQSLELRAERHVACTGPNEFPAIGNESYLVYFDYKTSKGMPAKYNLAMNGYKNYDFEERLPDTKGQWKSYSQILDAPFGTGSMKLTFYSIPSVEKGETTTLYDNIRIIKVPKIAGKFFVATKGSGSQTASSTVRYQSLNPSKITVTLTEVKGTVNLVLNDTYNNGWHVIASNNSYLPFGIRSLPAQHIKINRQENAWLLDVDAYCSKGNACTANSDGTYTLQANIEFLPQRWLWLGLSLSSTALVAALAYIVGSRIHDQRRGI